MANVAMSAKEKIEKAKNDLKRAQEKVKKLEEQRRLEIADILFKAIPNISDYDDVTLEKVFKEITEKLK